MLANVFPTPYIDVLKHFLNDPTLTEQQGDVQIAIDKAIGKRVFAVRGANAATNYVAMPAPGRANGLGVESPLLYLQIRFAPNAPFALHIDLIADRT